MARPRGPRRWFFDGWSLFYDLPWVQRAVYRAPQDAVVARLAATGSARVLDVGCGTGQLAARLRRELGARVVGCDFSRGMLRAAQARDRVAGWVQGDACRLPFREASFDAVVSTRRSTGSRTGGRRCASSGACSARAVTCSSRS
jgi:ubiquinone/menaquinone biosynthesis C-methylase UbiE